MKITAPIFTTLLCLSAPTTTSAFIVPAASTTTPSSTALHATSPNSPNNFIGATIATATVLSTSPLAAIAEQAADDEYVYGAVNAPGGIGLAAVLGVLAILTAAVPVILAPGEDAFNEMKKKDENKWGK
ncbi:hypothetical protein ACHAWU_000631 [Discostella pseudostelligera]|uniref:Uncharacterized protein n=1 Tax=Discostella pseudostelligera TaxID=259834 RepID=A0ABD3MEZ0_9STRA